MFMAYETRRHCIALAGAEAESVAKSLVLARSSLLQLHLHIQMTLQGGEK